MLEDLIGGNGLNLAFNDLSMPSASFLDPGLLHIGVSRLVEIIDESADEFNPIRGVQCSDFRLELRHHSGHANSNPSWIVGV
jgi:hypothetical protein